VNVSFIDVTVAVVIVVTDFAFAVVIVVGLSFAVAVVRNLSFTAVNVIASFYNLS
jgi:hypothetical protein